MRGRGSLNVRSLRLLISQSSVLSGRRLNSLVVLRTDEQHPLSLDRSSGVDDVFPDHLRSFWNNVCSTGVPDDGLSPYLSTSAWMNEVASGRRLAAGAVVTAPADVSRAASHEFKFRLDSPSGLVDTRKMCCHSLCLPSNTHHAGCGPRMSASFATLREQVKDEDDEEESREHEQQSIENLTDERQDTVTNSGRSEDTVTNSGFGRIDPNDVHEKRIGRIAEESRRSVAWIKAGWTREEVWNWPNCISMVRLLSGPVLAWMILHELWSPALIGLIIAGFSDWLDGYVARRMEIISVLGSYLDPIADKVLVGSVALSMAYAGLLHPALVGLVVARDGVLVGGAVVYRAYSLRWQWRNWGEFFRINVGGAGKVEPLFISKVNTVLQLGLIGVALAQPAWAIEDTYSLVPLLSWSVAGTTTISWACYVYQYLKNPDSLAALRHFPQTPSDRKY